MKAVRTTAKPASRADGSVVRRLQELTLGGMTEGGFVDDQQCPAPSVPGCGRSYFLKGTPGCGAHPAPPSSPSRAIVHNGDEWDSG
jgi:hypothetical protein